jgi:hypothetical protein
MNKKYVKEKMTYEFDIKSFETYKAYQITLPTIGLQLSTFVGILVHAAEENLSFIVADKYLDDRINVCCGDDHGILNIDIDDYMKGDISILKLGVVEPNE